MTLFKLKILYKKRKAKLVKSINTSRFLFYFIFLATSRCKFGSTCTDTGTGKGYVSLFALQTNFLLLAQCVLAAQSGHF